MHRKLKCIMLIDDNKHDNFFHERAIRKIDADSVIIVEESGADALAYLKSKTEPHSDLIFLDINMPGMNGWEFLKEYSLLDDELKSRATIIMLSTSDHPRDVAEAKKWSFVADYITKPLTEGKMKEIVEKYFK
jgi:response regulator RpfG family c-di-GMP phosphodiesterase